jgi:hypothetical protein
VRAVRRFLVRSISTGAALVALTACATATVSRSTSAGEGAPAPSPDTQGETWVAILGAADEPDRLTADRGRVLAALGDVLEGYVVISPAACLAGLPPELDATYVLAIERESREDVRALASQLTQEPSFIGAVTSLCTD